MTKPKNGAFLGYTRHATVRDESCVHYVRWYCPGLPGETKLWIAGSKQAFSLLYEKLRVHAGLGRVHLTPGCLRPGGATWLYACGVEVARLKFLGRWSSERSLNCYIQVAFGKYCWSSLPSEDLARVENLVNSFPAVWLKPLRSPAAVLLGQDLR